MPTPEHIAASISAIVPARDEEAVIAACVESLTRQPEIVEILVVNDQSTDRTADIVRGLREKFPHLRLLETRQVPSGWVGKNNAVWLGANSAHCPWLLFTDADAVLAPAAAARALQLAHENTAALVSFSPEQLAETWYEKSLIPFIYCRLAKHFSFDAVNDLASRQAAANGQFLMIRRDAYHAIGGHASVAGEVLEDVALAKRVKAAGYRLWFASGKGVVRVRMYRSFTAMWEGWKKNLFPLMGGTTPAIYAELRSVIPWAALLFLLLGLKLPLAAFLGLGFLVSAHAAYGLVLSRNQFPLSFIWYYMPAVALYVGTLWASYRGHASGKVAWKGREYPVATPGPTR